MEQSNLNLEYTYRSECMFGYMSSYLCFCYCL